MPFRRLIVAAFRPGTPARRRENAPRRRRFRPPRLRFGGWRGGFDEAVEISRVGADVFSPLRPRRTVLTYKREYEAFHGNV